MSDTEPARTLWRGGGTLSVMPASLPTRAQRCLVRAAVGPVDGIADALAEWRSLVDLDGPIDGGSYRLIPMVFHRMQSAGIDDPNRGMFRGVYRLSVVETTRIVHAVTPALHALGDAGIASWLTKGAGLVSAGYYPTLATRPMADIDVAVDFAQRDEAFDVLESLGFRAQARSRMLDHEHAALFMSESGVEVDLHWHHLKHTRSVDADEIITRKSQTAELNGVSMRVPGPAGLLIVSAVHGLVSNPEPPVRWLVDAAMVLARDGEQVAWDDVVEFASRFRLARRIETALSLLAATTGQVAPDHVFAALAELPTRPVERLERRILTSPWNSRGEKIGRLVAAYAGGDRELRRFPVRFPRYLAQIWNVTNLYQLPAVGVRRLWNWLRPGRHDVESMPLDRGEGAKRKFNA